MKNVLGIALVLVPFLGLGCSKDSDPPAGSGGSGGTRSGGSGGARAGGDGGSSTAGSGGNPVTSGGTGGGVSGGAGGGGAAGGAGGTGGRAGSGGSGGGASDGPRGSGGAPGDGPAPVQGNPFVYVSTGNFSGNHLNIYQLNMMTGALEAKGMVPTGSGPTYADFSPDGKYVYVLNESASQVEAFSANRETGALTRINGVASGGAGPAHLSVHKSGKWVFAAHYTNGNLSVLPVNAQGGVGAAVYTDKPVPGQAHFVINDPSGKYVFLCAASANDRVVQYTINEATGQLTPNTPAFISGQGRSPRHMAFHPNGLWAYVIGEGGGNVLFLKLDPATGKLATPGVVVQGGMDGTHVLVHPNGKFLYTTFRGSSRVQVYSIAADGNLTSVQMVTEGIARPWDFTIDPSGSFVLVANDGNGTVKVFRINQESGMLTAAGNGAAVGNPHFVGVLK